MARDIIHNAVKHALINDGWKITADPYRIKYKSLEVQADLGADRPIAAEKGMEKIVVEVKSFLGRALLHELYTALGQYTFYLRLLEKTAPERKLYLAVSDVVYNDFFSDRSSSHGGAGKPSFDPGREYDNGGNSPMDKLTHYRQIIKQVLSQYVEFEQQAPSPGVERFVIADEQNDHYLLFSLGWENRQRVRNLRVYVRLRNDKIWIEHDLTEEGIATDLLREGVPKEDIVLAFHAPEMRSFTEFAAA